MDLSKICTVCGADKPLSEFRRQSRNKDGLMYWCKECQDQKNKERYLKKRDHCIAKSREWNLKNPEKLKKYQQQASKLQQFD